MAIPDSIRPSSTRLGIAASCEVSELQIEQYCAGSLEGKAAIDFIETHLLSCPQCQQRVIEADEFLLTLSRATTLKQHTKEPSKQFHLFGAKGLAVAACIAMATLTISLYRPPDFTTEQGTGSEVPVLRLSAYRGPEIVQVAHTPFQLFLDEPRKSKSARVLTLLNSEGKLIARSESASQPFIKLAKGLPPEIYIVKLAALNDRELLLECVLRISDQ